MVKKGTFSELSFQSFLNPQSLSKFLVALRLQIASIEMPKKIEEQTRNCKKGAVHILRITNVWEGSQRGDGVAKQDVSPRKPKTLGAREEGCRNTGARKFEPNLQLHTPVARCGIRVQLATQKIVPLAYSLFLYTHFFLSGIPLKRGIYGRNYNLGHTTWRKMGVEEKGVREWHHLLGCQLALRMKLGLFHNK